MPTTEERWKYTWDYFALHAQQRLTTFNFFLVFATLLTGGLLATFQKEFRLPALGAIVGLLLMVISFVFWRLDQRNRHLIKNAEHGLRSLEQLWAGDETVSACAVFLRDAAYVERARQRDATRVLDRHWSYSDCFNTVYLAVGTIGAAGTIASICSR